MCTRRDAWKWNPTSNSQQSPAGEILKFDQVRETAFIIRWSGFYSSPYVPGGNLNAYVIPLCTQAVSMPDILDYAGCMSRNFASFKWASHILRFNCEDGGCFNGKLVTSNIIKTWQWPRECFVVRKITPSRTSHRIRLLNFRNVPRTDPLALKVHYVRVHLWISYSLEHRRLRKNVNEYWHFRVPLPPLLSNVYANDMVFRSVLGTSGGVGSHWMSFSLHDFRISEYYPYCYVFWCGHGLDLWALRA